MTANANPELFTMRQQSRTHTECVEDGQCSEALDTPQPKPLLSSTVPPVIPENSKDAVVSAPLSDGEEDQISAAEGSKHHQQQHEREDSCVEAIPSEVQDRASFQTVDTRMPNLPETDGLCTGMSNKSSDTVSPPLIMTGVVTVVWINPVSPLVCKHAY